MKLFISIVSSLCAIAALIFSVYKAIPIFPYLKDPEVLGSFAAFLLFYYIAYKTGSSRKKSALS